jgi:hypothetical protein
MDKLFSNEFTASDELPNFLANFKGNCSLDENESPREIFPQVRKHLKEESKIDQLNQFLYLLDVYMETIKSFHIKTQTLDPNAIISQFYETLKVKNNEILLFADKLANSIVSKSIIKVLKETFRQYIKGWLFQSFLMKRAYQKPEGYPGDFELLEGIYKNKIISKYIGALYDYYFLNDPLAVAVRNRKEGIKNLLKDLILNSKNKLKILNLACGPCREIIEMQYENHEIYRKAAITCVDFDEKAILFSQTALHLFKSQEIDFLKTDVLKNADLINKKFGIFDIIYSIGLVDYLPNRIFKKILSDYFKLLDLQSGVLIISHKDQDIYKPIAADWFCDWTFYKRTQKEVINLVNESAAWRNIKVIREPSGIIYFLILIK